MVLGKLHHTHTHTHKDTQPTRPRPPPPPPPRAPGPMAPHTRDPFPTPFRRDTHCTREKTIRQTDSGSGLGVAEGKVPRLPAPATNGSGCLGIGRWPGWVRLLAASGDTGRLWRRPWTGDKARDEPSPPPCLPLPGRPRRALGAGSPRAWSLSCRPPAACSHGADAHAHAHAHYWRGPATEAAGAAGEALCGPRPWVHGWFSGRILACHAGGPGSIPGPCNAPSPFGPAAPTARYASSLPPSEHLAKATSAPLWGPAHAPSRPRPCRTFPSSSLARSPWGQNSARPGAKGPAPPAHTPALPFFSLMTARLAPVSRFTARNASTHQLALPPTRSSPSLGTTSHRRPSHQPPPHTHPHTHTPTHTPTHTRSGSLYPHSRNPPLLHNRQKPSCHA